MKTIIKTPNFSAKQELEEFIHQKTSKLEEMNQNILEINVILLLGDTKSIKNKYCEIKVTIPGKELFVKKSSASFEESAVKSIDTIRKMFRRDKVSLIRQRKQKIQIT